MSSYWCHEKLNHDDYYDSEDDKLREYAGSILDRLVEDDLRKKINEEKRIEEEKKKIILDKKEKELKDREEYEEALFPERNEIATHILEVCCQKDSPYTTIDVKKSCKHECYRPIGSIDIRFSIWDCESIIPAWFQFKIEFFEQAAIVSLYREYEKEKFMLSFFDYDENDATKEFSYIKTEKKDILEKYKNVLTEIFRVLKKASDLTDIIEFNNKTPDVKAKLIYYFWENAKKIDENDKISFDETMPLYIDSKPVEYYCGRYFGFLNFNSDWIDPFLYGTKNTTDEKDIYIPLRKAFQSTRDDFSDLFIDYDYNDEDDDDEDDDKDEFPSIIY